MEDVGAPVAVTAANLIVKSVKPEWEDYAVYGIAAAGYISAFMNWGGPFMKNVGIAELPMAAEKLYNKLTIGGRVASRNMSMRRVARYPAPAAQGAFGGARLT